MVRSQALELCVLRFQQPSEPVILSALLLLSQPADLAPLFWMIVAAFFGMATKYAEGLLAIKYRTIDKEGHVLGGPFYYIENGMGKQWRWLAKIFAFFGAGVGLFGIGTFTQVNGIASAVNRTSLIRIPFTPFPFSEIHIPGQLLSPA